MPRGQRGASRKPLTLLDHIRELRMRLCIVAIAFIVGSSLAYVLRDQLIHLLLAPLHGQKLVYLNVAGGFNFIFLVSIYAGLAVAAPLLLQQLYLFLKPILPAKVQTYAVRIFLSSFVLLAAGIAFGYIFAIPGALSFLYTFAGDYVQASLTADSYLSFIMAYTIGLGLVFQLPLILLFIHWIKPMKPGSLLRSERWIILAAFIVAAILTPTPDPLNQTIIALPIILVYQIGVIAILISVRRSTLRARRVLRKQPSAPASSIERVAPTVPTSPHLPIPTATPITISRPTHAHRPSIDGMRSVAPRTPQQPRNLRVPARASTPSLAPTRKPLTSRRVLAIDGVSPVFG